MDSRHFPLNHWSWKGVYLVDYYFSGCYIGPPVWKEDNWKHALFWYQFMFPYTIQKELKRSRLLARALAFALVRFREHYDMLSNPLSICKSGWQSKMIPNPWVIRDDSGWSLVVPNEVLDWNSLCSTSHLCNDLIYTLVDSTGLEIQVQWDGNGRDVQGLQYQWVWQKLWWVSEYHICWNFSLQRIPNQFPRTCCCDPLTHLISFHIAQVFLRQRLKTSGQIVLQSPIDFKLPSTST